jgi:hypothetical protein
VYWVYIYQRNTLALKSGIWRHVLMRCIIYWLYLVDSRYLEFDGTMEKIWVDRSSTQEELWKHRKCSLFNDERETIRAKFWRAKTSIACHDSRNDFKHIQCFCCCFFFLLNSLNLGLITSRYLFFVCMIMFICFVYVFPLLHCH